MTDSNFKDSVLGIPFYRFYYDESKRDAVYISVRNLSFRENETNWIWRGVTFDGLGSDLYKHPDFIDYLNICASSRYRNNSSVNSYSYIKAIAEELRGLAVEANVPIVSATQTTRSGFASSDVDLKDTSESFGLPATADLMFALISTEDLEGLNQIMVKQLKNRYNDPTVNKRFIVGIDRAKMRLYDCEQKAQEDIVDSGQEEEYNKKEEKFKKNFDEFKF